VDCDLAGRGRNQNIRRMRERRTFLDVVIAYQSKATALSKYSGFVVD